MSLFGIVLLAIALQQVPQNQTGIIEGTVNLAGNNKPIAGVHIHVTRDGVSSARNVPFNADAITDDSGRFTLRAVPTGSVRIEASRSGYLAPSGASSVSTTVGVRANERTEVTGLTLIKSPIIRGLITDSEDRPVAGVGVEILRLSIDERGRKTWSRASPPLRSDAQGHFELTSIRPGEYYVRAALGMPNAAGRVVYFPGTLDFNAAAKITAREGETIFADIRFPHVQTTTFKVSGRILHSLSRPANSPSIGISLVERDPFTPLERTLPASIARTTMDETTGRFEVRGIRPGTYDLFVTAPASGKNYLSKVTVDVRDRDVEDVDVVVRPGVDVKARLIADDNSQDFRFALLPGDRSLPMVVRRPAKANIQLSVTRKDGYPYRAQFVVDEQGTLLTFPDLPEGDYEVSAEIKSILNNTDFYISDVRVAGRSVYADGIRVGLDPVDSLEILIGTRGGTLTGVVLGKGKSSVRIIVVPDQLRRNNPALYRMESLFTKDDSGQFRIRGIPPGTYKIFAVAVDDDPVPYRSSEFAAQYENRAVSVQMDQGITTSIRVPILRRD